MRRVFWILLTPLAIGFLLFAFAKMFIAPHFKLWALQKIEAYSEENLPVRIHVDKMNIRLLRPAVSLENITITPKESLAELFPEIKIVSATAYVDFVKLLGGRLSLSAIVVDDASASLNLDPLLRDTSPAKEIPIDQLFTILEELPLQRIFLQNISLDVTSQDLGLDINLRKAGLLLTNMGKNLTAKAAFPLLQGKLKNLGDIHGSVDTHLYLTRQSLRVIQLGVHLNESELLGRGEFSRVSQIFIRPSGVLSFSANLKLTDIHDEIIRNRPKFKIPAFSGSLETEIETRFDGFDKLSAKADIQTKSLKFDKFDLGDARIQGEFKDNTIHLSEIELDHPSGHASVTKSQLRLDDTLDFKAQVKVDSLDLQKLFTSLDLPGIPVGVALQGSLPCSGHVRPEFLLQCDGVTLSGQKLWVKSSSDNKGLEIVNVDSLSASGSVTVTTKAVQYNAELKVQDNTGTTDGVIDFSKGFRINYKTPRLDMKNIRNLAHLKLEGFSSLEGFTEGDSNSAIFDIRMNARDFIFEDFKLGNLVTLLKYRKGDLIFEDIAGAIGKTQYMGDLTVDLNHSQLKGDFTIPTVELPDVATVLSGLYKFPLELSGKGTARAHIQGPLNFWKMTYNIDSSFKNIEIGPESFDSLIFNVSAQNGNILADKVVLQKSQSTLKVNGGIGADQEFKMFIEGLRWKLEESDTMSLLANNIAGNINFSSELRGHIKNPQLIVKGAITDTYLDEQDLPNSHFSVKINRQSLGGDIRMFGDRIQGQFQMPFEGSTQPFLLKGQTSQWEFSKLLALVGGNNLAAEYESRLTSEFDLRSESGDLFKSSGKIVVEEFFLKRGQLSTRNSQPIEIRANNGAVSIKNFTLTGPKNQISVVGENFSAQKLDLTVNLRLDLRLLQIFFPFLDDLGGPVALSATLSGPYNRPQILGSTSLTNSFLRLKGFPHPIEKLNADVAFSQSRVIVNSINATMAGGTISGEGGIQINGLRDMPTSIRLALQNVTLNVPDKVRTSGNAELLLSGKWFPFVLSGTYHINSGLVEKEFTEEPGGALGVRQSRYLPKVLRQSSFEPILLDMQIALGKNILVKNSLVDGAVTGNLQIKGPPTNPVLLGRISMDKKSKLIFKDKIFDIQNGVIDFKDPNEINPDLYMSATSRIDDYDVTVLAQGPSKNLNIRLTSIPPLSEQDIVSLIALGVTSTNLDQNVQSKNQAEQTGVEIGGAIFAKPLNKELEKNFGLNLQLTNQYDSTRNISVPKVTLSRRLSEKMKVSGSRPVGDSQSYDIKLEYQLNNNINAIGSFESKGTEDDPLLQNSQQEYQSIFGLDLEFKREFR